MHTKISMMKLVKLESQLKSSALKRRKAILSNFEFYLFPNCL